MEADELALNINATFSQKATYLCPTPREGSEGLRLLPCLAGSPAYPCLLMPPCLSRGFVSCKWHKPVRGNLSKIGKCNVGQRGLMGEGWKGYTVSWGLALGRGPSSGTWATSPFLSPPPLSLPLPTPHPPLSPWCLCLSSRFSLCSFFPSVSFFLLLPTGYLRFSKHMACLAGSPVWHLHSKSRSPGERIHVVRLG